jgi:hypothetical protein
MIAVPLEVDLLLHSGSAKQMMAALHPFFKVQAFEQSA